jgi:hypothetical protein
MSEAGKASKTRHAGIRKSLMEFPTPRIAVDSVGARQRSASLADEDRRQSAQPGRSRDAQTRIGLTLGRLGRLLVEPAEWLLRWDAARRKFSADFNRHGLGGDAFDQRNIDDGPTRGGIRGPRRLRIAAAATATVTARSPLRIAAARISKLSTAALALPAGRILFFLMADAIARGKGDFELMQLVPLLFGTLVVGNSQQGLHAATRRLV